MKQGECRWRDALRAGLGRRGSGGGRVGGERAWGGMLQGLNGFWCWVPGGMYLELNAKAHPPITY